ncbi:MAG: hypothetical protein GX896_08275 [Clostridiales bacterium]|nr:hypothetical protein [Clostridiales bacterium]
MKLLLGQIVNASSTLGRLADEKLPISESFKLAKLNKSLASELEIYDKERIKICEQYGDKDEENNRYNIKNQVEFEKAFSELLGLEIEMEFKKVNLTADIKITANELMLAEDFINFEEEKDNA